MQIGSAFGNQRGQEQPCRAASMAADNRESDNSEHQSGSGDQHSMCRQPAHESTSLSIKVEATEGAGETGELSRLETIRNVVRCSEFPICLQAQLLRPRNMCWKIESRLREGRGKCPHSCGMS